MDAGFDIAALGDAVALESVDDVLEVALDEELGLVDEGLVDGAVLGVDEDELDDDGDVLGLIDELDDVDPLGAADGVVVVDGEDVEGDGVTTGGVVVLGVFVSRWQPATPSVRPAQRSVIKGRLRIVISIQLRKRALRDLADSVPREARTEHEDHIIFCLKNSVSPFDNDVVQRPIANNRPTRDAEISSDAGNNYAARE